MELTDKKYEFRSNIYLGKRSIAPRLNRVIKVVTILYILLILFEIMMEGLSFEIIKDNFLMISLLLFSNSNTKYKDKFSLANVKVDISSEEISIAYDGVDKEDKKGAMNEKFTFKYKDITQIQYSEKYKGVNIIGFPVREFRYLVDKDKNNNIENYKEKNIPKNTLVFLTDEYRRTIISDIKEYSRIEVINIE